MMQLDDTDYPLKEHRTHTYTEHNGVPHPIWSYPFECPQR